jgi:NAD(P)-dependent dehydrogenase (short-subunit alcohol dehydrogenase family)
MNNSSVCGKVLLVTAVTGAIGESIAEYFLQNQAKVMLSFRSQKKTALKLYRRLKKISPDVAICHCDLADEQQVRHLVEYTVDTFGSLDILVNAAGSYPVQDLLSISHQQWCTVIDDNLTSAFLLLQNSARWMKTSGGGSIVQIASLSAVLPSHEQAHYSSAKAGLVMLTKAAAIELAPYNIRVNSISPGLIRRAGIEESWPEGVQRWQQRCPLLRMGYASEIAKLALFLSSTNSAFITGQNLLLDGGMSAVNPST